MKQALPLAFTLLLPAALRAQDIPNAGFEAWTTVGSYQDPTGWRTSNMVSYSVDGSLTCEQGSPGAVGDHFVKVSDRLLDGMGMQSGSINTGTEGMLFPGFPFTERPDAFNGHWQYHPVGVGHDGVVGAVLSRWNPVMGNRDIIANASMHALDPITAWESFSVPFLYYSDLVPDTANVMIIASQNTTEDGTSIWVDDLGFGQLQSVPEVEGVAVELWPSPASDQLRIRAGVLLSEVLVQDLSGRLMGRTTPNRAETVVPVSALPAGMYLAQLRMADGRRAVRTFVKE
jgi:hypothetical protein